MSKHMLIGMRTHVLVAAACAALLPACIGVNARPTAGFASKEERGASRDGDDPDAAAQRRIGLVTLSTTGEHPVRGGVYWSLVGDGKRLTSVSCAEDESLWYCARDRWLVGENRRERIEHPAQRDDALLVAADLGIGVHFGTGADEKTIIYLGDSAGRPMKAGCGAAHPAVDCNDAILVVDPTDTDPSDGVSTQVVVGLRADGAIEGFVPQLVPGVNGRDALEVCAGKTGRKGRPACLGAFNVPTGVAAARVDASLVAGARAGAGGFVDAVVLFYAAAIARGEATSWIAASTDGYRFSRLERGPFSRDKFIQVAPVPLSAQARRALCDATPGSPLCDASLGIEGDVLLLFGNGESYRASRLYLGVLGLSDLARRYYHLDPATGRETWVSEEAGATPIVSGEGSDAFGELSVALVGRESCPVEARGSCADTLVLLANRDGIVRYRTASLAFPGARGPSASESAWSAERSTSGQGYGPYILDAFTRIEKGAAGGLELVLYHTVSAWNGRTSKAPDRAPYGVFTRRLMLIDPATCRKGVGGEPYCVELPPPWPPEP